MNERIGASDGTETLDRHANGSAAASDVPAGSLWANAIGTIVAPRKAAVAADHSGDQEVPEGLEAETLPRLAAVGTNGGSSAALLDLEESGRLRGRWSEIQGQFVDEPRLAVQQADALVSEVIEQVTRVFAKEHSSLGDQWKRGDDVSTEELRKALQHYRAFFNRLLA